MMTDDSTNYLLNKNGTPNIVQCQPRIFMQPLGCFIGGVPL